jgi:hypothetical protein
LLSFGYFRRVLPNLRFYLKKNLGKRLPEWPRNVAVNRGTGTYQSGAAFHCCKVLVVLWLGFIGGHFGPKTAQQLADLAPRKRAIATATNRGALVG